MIVSFGDDMTESLYHGIENKDTRKIQKNLKEIVFRKLDLINAAAQIKDLQIPPGNRLEKLKGKFQNFYSIRVNDQYRIIFEWENNNAFKVLLTDYH